MNVLWNLDTLRCIPISPSAIPKPEKSAIGNTLDLWMTLPIEIIKEYFL